MKPKLKLIYELKIINRKTNIVINTIEFTNYLTAKQHLNFYNSTLNLRAELNTISK